MRTPQAASPHRPPTPTGRRTSGHGHRPQSRPVCSTPTSSRTRERVGAKTRTLDRVTDGGDARRHRLRPPGGTHRPGTDRAADAARHLVDQGVVSSIAMCATCPRLLHPGDLVVVNDTKVLPLGSARRSTGGAAEICFSSATMGRGALAKPSKKLKPGDVVTAEGCGRDGRGPRRWSSGRPSRPGRCRPARRLAEVGLPPLPPTSRLRSTTVPVPDRLRRSPAFGCCAHGGLLHPGRSRGAAGDGITMATVELAVGLDTFRPVMVDRLDDHVMHSEWYRVPDETVAAVEAAERLSRSAPPLCARSSRGRPPVSSRAEQPLHSTPVRMEGGRRLAHQLSPASVDAAVPRRRLHRPSLAGALRDGGRRGLSLSQFRRPCCGTLSRWGRSIRPIVRVRRDGPDGQARCGW